MASGNREKLKAFFKRPFGDDSDAPTPSEIIVVSPYISRDALEDALSPVEDWEEYPHITIISSWRTTDLVSGASDIGVYELCRDKGWKLRVNFDKSTRKIHLKAYVAHYHLGGHVVGRGMIGSANLTNSGLDSNVEYLHPVQTARIDNPDPMVLAHYDDYVPGREPGSPSLHESISFSFDFSREVDDEDYESMKEHLEAIGTRESEKLPNWEPPPTESDPPNQLAAAIMDAMPPRPGIQELAGISALEDVIEVRGLRFSQVRRIVSEHNPGMRRDALNQLTNETMEGMQSHELDLQRGPRGHHTLCLVWRLQPIINKLLWVSLHEHTGKTLRDLGLAEDLCDKSLMGSRSQLVRETCRGLLDDDLRQVVDSMSTWDATIVLNEKGLPKENRPVGPRILLDDLPPPESRPEILDYLWLPSFCVYKAEKGSTLGDVVLLGFGFWEPRFQDVNTIIKEFSEDMMLIPQNADALQKGDSSFLPKENHREHVFVKVRTGGGKGSQPLASPQRPLCHYLTKDTLRKIVRGIN